MTKRDKDDKKANVCKSLGYEFKEPMLLERALTHKSFTNEFLGKGEDNQRLEFLGDAVLGLVVAEVLMEQMPGVPEGILTPARAALVNETTLAQLAKKIDLGDAIRLGKGEELNEGRERSSILSDAVEAVIGAVYLDGGYDDAQLVVLSWLSDEIESVISGGIPNDVKTKLQEQYQSAPGAVPIYHVVGEEGPDHAKVFEVEIRVAHEVLARGKGRSKKEAEKAAAVEALKKSND